MIRGDLYLGVLLISALLHSVTCNKGNKHKPWMEAQYQGIIMENDNTVLLNPPLFALDKDSPLRYAGEICGFRIHGSGTPFEAVVLDRTTGEGLIRAKGPVDCEAQREHTFTIQAHDCGEGPDGSNSKKSHKATVHVRVNDVNEFAPVFGERVFRASVTEGRMYERVLRVQAWDQDCSPQYSQVCFYQILTPNVPFTIDNDGYIKNTQPLQANGERLIRFTVTAYDCGKKRAVEDAEVEIQVKPTCKPSWRGWNKRIEYVPGTGNLALFPSIHLETCEEPVWSIQATIEIQTSHVAKGCDRDNYSEKSLRKLCGAAPGDVDLLPPSSTGYNWTRGLPVQETQDSSLVFWFNGSQSVEIPPARLPAGGSAADHLTLSFWLKHAGGGGKSGKDEEVLLCNTVQNEGSFSHYTLAVHGCRISFLYWSLLDSARPVKFLWKLEQVCDGEWHHYALSLAFPTVSLYVDGVTYDPALIHDNGALPPPKRQARLMIGGCWADEKLSGKSNGNETTRAAGAVTGRFLRGYVSGFALRLGSVDSREVIECLYSCKEGLQYTDFDSLGKGMKVHVNPAQSQLTLEGDDPTSFSRALQHVEYLNSLQFPTPGVRPLKLQTIVRCLSDEGCLSVPDLEGYLVVLQPDAPQVLLSGSPRSAHPISDFQGPLGVPIFPDLRITCSVSHSLTPNKLERAPRADLQSTDGIECALERCEVGVVGEDLNLEYESLSLDMSSAWQRGLETENSSRSFRITGVQNVAVYEDILRSLTYRTGVRAALYARKFHVSCSEMNGRYVSNQLYTELDVLHGIHAVSPSHLLSGQQFVHNVHQAPVALSSHTLTTANRNSVFPGVAMVIIVVCVGFLALIVTLGLSRIHSVRQRDGIDSVELEASNQRDPFWEDSAMTITVNPMESVQSRNLASTKRTPVSERENLDEESR
ncbi:calsyntenin-3 isoform X1 [Pelobates cultripes]|uniref:Calsyntenin-3 n=1 Tax=Pelobates cultripes TaxID=61616 RepID=A0AAD1WR60_PELCU|nr:calsyntenin-3 isoform X1 [Pelobates cultripes]